jgi:hypothetical protein
MIDVPSTSETVRPEQRLSARVLAFIGGSSGEDFDALALAVHHYQYRHNPPYRRFAERHGARAPRSWREIPAVPAVAFKESVLACAPPERIYESSGTSEGPGRRSRHHVASAALYRAAALSGFQRVVLPAGTRLPFVVAAPERASHPTSSLGEMVSWLREAHDAGAMGSCLSGRSLDLPALAARLDALDPGRPVLVVALTAALLQVADHGRRLGRRWRLPAGSLVVDTGGCKGYGAELARADIVARYGDAFGLEPSAIVNEYGMTELCSQLYARGLGPLCGPPWLRTLVWDPRTGREAPPGEPGLLRHFDLANVGSVLAVQTDDLGAAVDGGIALLGRAERAEARGCSLLLAR